ncbi:hypothetical protein BC827DRAFT_1185295 [Russula dissimulans]|nr:hypothetical protein BC827DRAFT_1185224 [Russula dissimulans]KAH9964832.1 hypothetical protein BC827DRAFT_1185295 [Russula dissimulans]
MATHPPPNSTFSDSIQLLSGPIDDFLLFSRQEHSKWLIDIAHDLCDPLAQRGSLCIWAGQEWRTVAHTEPLTASIYLYAVPEGVVISLSKISARDGKSKTSTIGEASTMANLVNDRDGQCWITDSVETLVNGHLCPKRMGDHLARVIFDTFVSAHPPTLSIYDETFGISLLSSLNGWFDNYELGLRFVSTVRSSFSCVLQLMINDWFTTQNQYECHSFGSPPTKLHTYDILHPAPLRDLQSPCSTWAHVPM